MVDAADAEARYRALFAALREPILMASANGRVAGFNAAARDLFGGAARLYGRPIHELLPFVAPIEGGDEQASWQGRLADAAGHTLFVEATRTRLDEARWPAVDVYVVHDVPRDVELDRLHEQWLSSVAHELRGPQTVLDNALDVLATDFGELSASDFDRLVGSARRAAAHLHDLIDELVSAGSIQSGRFRVRPRPIALSAIVDDALKAVQPALDAREQRVEHELAERPLYVLADRYYARQAVAHLLRNAARCSPDGELIRMRTVGDGAQLRITIEDRGPGIETEQRAGLFEQFDRVRPGDVAARIGLGLAIAKGIIEAHGGNIGVEGEIGVGTSVWFTLPEAGEPG